MLGLTINFLSCILKIVYSLQRTWINYFYFSMKKKNTIYSTYIYIHSCNRNGYR